HAGALPARRLPALRRGVARPSAGGGGALRRTRPVHPPAIRQGPQPQPGQRGRHRPVRGPAPGPRLVKVAAPPADNSGWLGGWVVRWLGGSRRGEGTGWVGHGFARLGALAG